MPERGQNTHKIKYFSIMSGAHKPVGSGSMKNIDCLIRFKGGRLYPAH